MATPSVSKQQEPELARITPRIPLELARKIRGHATLKGESQDELVSRGLEFFFAHLEREEAERTVRELEAGNAA